MSNGYKIKVSAIFIASRGWHVTIYSEDTCEAQRHLLQITKKKLDLTSAIFAASCGDQRPELRSMRRSRNCFFFLAPISAILFSHQVDITWLQHPLVGPDQDHHGYRHHVQKALDQQPIVGCVFWKKEGSFTDWIQISTPEVNLNFVNDNSSCLLRLVVHKKCFQLCWACTQIWRDTVKKKGLLHFKTSLFETLDAVGT
jgi:hypothetical protein